VLKVPAGNAGAAIVNGGGATVIVIAVDFVWTGSLESPTVTANEKFPATVGEPEMIPLDDASEIPAGRLPEESFQVYSGVPPVASRSAEYCVPSIPEGKILVVIVNGGAVVLRDASAI